MCWFPQLRLRAISKKEGKKHIIWTLLIFVELIDKTDTCWYLSTLLKFHVVHQPLWETVWRNESSTSRQCPSDQHWGSPPTTSSHKGGVCRPMKVFPQTFANKAMDFVAAPQSQCARFKQSGLKSERLTHKMGSGEVILNTLAYKGWLCSVFWPF